MTLAELATFDTGAALLSVPLFERYTEHGRLIQPFSEAVNAGKY
ncbi:hypothetical protein [Ruegeria sp. SCSIO 43209]|nr:hypothetical protein [Ruegeria sp. SCSIO 43209]